MSSTQLNGGPLGLVTTGADVGIAINVLFCEVAKTVVMKYTAFDGHVSETR